MKRTLLFLLLLGLGIRGYAGIFLLKGTIEIKAGTLKKWDNSYRFGFNGKEKDNEVKGLGNSLDFGARVYDSRLGRWLSLDPMAVKYPFASLYNFALNNPIWAKDPDGKAVVFINGFHTGEGGKSDYWRVYSMLK